MLAASSIYPTIPVTDLARAKTFYEDTLGLRVVRDYPPDSSLLAAGQGTHLCLYQRPPSKADHTLASFMVNNLESEMAALRGKGVTFEEYDFPGLKTVNGIATQGGSKCAWFKDSEGNILGLTQLG